MINISSHRATIALLVLLALSGCKTTPDAPADPEAEAIRQRARELEAQRDARLAEMNRGRGEVMTVPPGNVRINLERVSFDQRDRTAIDAMIGYRNEHVDVKVGGVGRNHGVKAVAMKDGWRGAISVGSSSRTSRSISSQFIVMAPGGEATLQAVTLKPRPWVVVIPVRRGEIVVSRSEYQVTGSGMAVRVHSIGPQGVDVELLPYFHAAPSSSVRGDAIRLDELRTRVVLPPGVPVAIMADSFANTEIAKQWLSYRRDDHVGETVLVMTVDVGR